MECEFPATFIAKTCVGGLESVVVVCFVDAEEDVVPGGSEEDAALLAK